MATEKSTSIYQCLEIELVLTSDNSNNSRNTNNNNNNGNKSSHSDDSIDNDNLFFDSHKTPTDS